VRLARLPLRVRLVAGFSAAMLVVLTGAGVFVYWRVQYALDRGLDTDLTQATSVLTGLVGPDGRVEDVAAATATGATWQLLGAGAQVLDHGGTATTPLVDSGVLGQVTVAPRHVDVGSLLPASRHPMRLEVSRLEGSGPAEYLVVGVRRDHRDEALRELLLQLGLAGLGALVLTALVGDRLARAALSPVERYRRRAAEIARGSSTLRLEVPPDRDDEVTRLGHTLNEMLSALERSVEHERRFVDDASHELRTPLTLLKSRVELARRRSRSVAEHEQVLAELAVDIVRLNALAEQLLRLGSTGGEMPERTDVARTVAGVVERRRLARPETASQLSVHLPVGRPADVVVAPLALERLVENLVQNAIVHGAPPIVISVDPVVRDGRRWVRITVEDAGAGMEPELLDTATERFARSPQARSRPGAGLGLSLVAATARAAGGDVRLCHGGRHGGSEGSRVADCEHGAGMTVTVRLPAAPDPQDAAGRGGPPVSGAV
jgi:signal transduction histidine kinase